jgi:multidrug efflux pump subunit AcrB
MTPETEQPTGGPEHPTPPPAPAPPGDLGLAGKMARSFIHSPLSALLYLAMLALGLLGLLITPRQEDPQISVPMIDLFLQFPGASSEEVAALAIDPLQRVMSEIPRVKHVYSTSARERGVVTIEFDVGEELGPSLVKVHDKIQSNLHRIPPGVQPPLVKAKGIDDVPILTLTLWSEVLDDAQLRTLALNLLQSLKAVPDTGEGFIVGGRTEQIRVEVMPERLAGYGLTFDQVAQTIRSANREEGVGDVERNNNHLTVYAGGFLYSAEQLAELIVGQVGTTPIYVRDVARVAREPEDTRAFSGFYTGAAAGHGVEGKARRIDGAPSVTIAIAKKIGTNGVSVANAILAKVEGLKGRMIPKEVQVEVTRNYGATANEKVNELVFKLFVATGAVTLLVWLALGLRPAVVVTVVIPVVILFTVFAAYLMGYTVDRVSLFALIFSIGILVDDAIVVVENIYRRWLLREDTDTLTAVDAVREVGNPTILATFTVVAALLPMGFVRGMMGPYMEPIPALGSVAMIFSLFAAFAFTPWFAMRLKPSLAALKKAAAKEHATEVRLDRFFRRLIGPLIDNRLLGWGFLLGLVAAFFAVMALFYTTAVPVKMLPFDNKAEFSVVVDLPEGTALPVTVNAVHEVAGVLRQIPEVTALTTYAGTAKPFDFNGMVRHYYLRSDPWQGEVHLKLLHKGQRSRSSHQIAAEARERLGSVAERLGATLTVVEMPPGPPVLQTVVADIYGPDAVTRREVAGKMTDIFRATEGMADVDNYMLQPYNVLRFEVDTQKAVRLGVSVDAIVRNLGMAFGGARVGDVKGGSTLEPTYIVVQVPLALRSDVERLADLPMPTQDGRTLALAELGRFVLATQDPLIHQKDLRPVEYVVGDAVGRLGAPIYPMRKVQEALAGYTTPDGMVLSGHFTGPPPDNGRSGFEWTGEWTVTYETFRDMGIAFGAALVLIYMLVVSQFGNFLVPAVIMAPIPLTLLGIVPGHWLMGAEFTATSMIGFIALAGIIVRNSILLVDFAIAEVHQGHTVREAVLLSCKARTRPIMITAFALVGGSSVILTDPIFQGMAVSLLFGVLVSTLLTLVVIPLGCISAGSHLAPSAAPEQGR